MVRTVAAAVAMSLLAGSAFAADGSQLFDLQCKACHVGSALGPPLSGIAGADIAAKAGFNYSAGLKAKEGRWTDANLDAYLKAPGQFATGSRMFMSVPSAENRAAIIGYLKTLK